MEKAKRKLKKGVNVPICNDTAMLTSSISAATSCEPTQSFQPSQSDGIIGYVKNVSPCKVSSKGTEYFSFNVVEKNRTVKALCFSPKRHKTNVDRKAESGLPCKITKYNCDQKEKDVIFVNYNTDIDEAGETCVDFSMSAGGSTVHDAAKLVTANEVEKIQVYQMVNMRGLLVFGSNKAEDVATKRNLTKLEGYLVDETGSVAITLWNDDIKLVEDGNFFRIDNARVRQFQGQKYVSTTTETKVEKVTEEEAPKLALEVVKEAKERLGGSTVECHSIVSVEIITFYTCVSCRKRVQSRQDSVVLKCGHCRSYMMTKTCPKTTAARIQVKTNDNMNWYTLFAAALEPIVENYKRNYTGEREALASNIEEIEHDKLSEIILLTEKMILKVRNESVVGVAFS